MNPTKVGALDSVSDQNEEEFIQVSIKESDKEASLCKQVEMLENGSLKNPQINGKLKPNSSLLAGKKRENQEMFLNDNFAHEIKD